MDKVSPSQKTDEMTLSEIRRKLDESGSWDDKKRLKENYKIHEDKFFGVIKSLYGSLEMFGVGNIDDKGFYSLELQDGKRSVFSINKDFYNNRGEGKLANHTEINTKTNAKTFLIYSPTKGVSFSYSADLIERNIQLGKDDFFGKNIENIIKNVASATEGVEYDTLVERFDKTPNAIKNFYVETKDFVPEEKQGDVISTIAVLDGIVRGIHSIPHPWLHGENFKR